MKKLEALSRGGEVLPLTRNTWMFMGNYRNAAFSAWLTGVDSVTLDRLEMYYSLNPGKRSGRKMRSTRRNSVPGSATPARRRRTAFF